MDRIVHHAQRIELKGESLKRKWSRKQQTVTNKKPTTFIVIKYPQNVSHKPSTQGGQFGAKIGAHFERKVHPLRGILNNKTCNLRQNLRQYWMLGMMSFCFPQF